MTVSTTMRWPSIARTPRAPLPRLGRPRHLRARRAGWCRCSVRYSRRDPEPGEPAARARRSSSIVRPDAFFARLGRDPKIGFGEAYMAGDWSAGEGTDLADLLTPFAARLTTLVPQPLQRLRGLVDKRHPAAPRATPSRARADNIAAHYDLSNELFAGLPRPDADATRSALVRRRRRPADRAGPRGGAAAQDRRRSSTPPACGAGTRVLEIGTGWGALAIRAAQRGAHASPRSRCPQEQLDLAAAARRGAGVSRPRRPAAAGLPRGRRAVRRDRQRRDDRGRRRGVLADLLRDASTDLLAPGGRVAIQAILMAHDRLLATRRSFGWIQKYIFPGGLIPSLAGDRRDPRGPHHAAGEPAPGARRRTTPRRCGCGASASSRTGRRSTPRASTRRSAGCGSSTSPTARPASAPATSTSASSS